MALTALHIVLGCFLEGSSMVVLLYAFPQIVPFLQNPMKG